MIIFIWLIATLFLILLLICLLRLLKWCWELIKYIWDWLFNEDDF